MQNPIRTIIAKVNKPTDKLRILCRPTHEGYQTSLSYTGHEFHMIQGPNIKRWDHHTRPLPPNHYIYNNPSFYPESTFDLILSQQRYDDLQTSLDLGQKLGLPVVHIDHTEPPPNCSKAQLKQMKSLRADVHCFITEHNKSSWGGKDEDLVIPHGIDTSIFTGYNGSGQYGISLVNHFASRDVFCGWNIWKDVCSQNIPMQLIGENPGMSESIKDPKMLAQTLSNARFFLNTSILSPCPLSLLEAAGVGLPIVSTAYQEVPKIFTHGVNAFLSNDPKELATYCKLLLANPDMAMEMGNKARQLIMEKFSMQAFINNWNNAFRKVL